MQAMQLDAPCVRALRVPQKAGWSFWAKSAALATVGGVALVARHGWPDGGLIFSREAPPGRRRLPSGLSGVNLGGWLCLEDWFFSGTRGRNVMSADPAGQGACLPPAVPGGSREPWPSEGILARRLSDGQGEAAAAEAFRAHRASYIGESDLQDIASLGIRHVRVPITWTAFADALARIDNATYGSHDPESDTVLVPDPLYPNSTSMATIPRKSLADLLRKARAYGLRILFDLHAFPGGAADGTYNGVWPQRPGFWTESSAVGRTDVRLTEAGVWIAAAMVEWLEGLDTEALGGLLGVSFMNEPAHMAYLDSQDPKKAFLESEDRVLAWLTVTADSFRQSSLPQKGKKLYMQVIDTAFANFSATVPQWYNRSFSPNEQQTWAVIDQHWYAAWSDGCSGRTIKGGGYFCDAPLGEARAVMKACVRSFASEFAREFPGQKACSEFSVGTYEDARFACNDPSLLMAFLEEQVAAFRDHGIEPFFWTWRMPYGQVFEPGWSLKRLAGLEERSAEVCDSAAIPTVV